MTDPVPEQIAYDLSKLCGNVVQEYSWVMHGGNIYYSTYVAKPYAPLSATVKLIQNIFEQFVDQSFFILRNRIYSTEASSEISRGTVSVVAKRVTFDVKPIDHALAYQAKIIRLPGDDQDFISSHHRESLDLVIPKNFKDHEEIKFWLSRVCMAVSRGEILHDHNRAIATIITDADLNTLSWSANSNSKNKTLHSEVIAIQEYFQRENKPLPEGAKVFVSLKPCKMCAAFISSSTENPKLIKVFYQEDDPGPLSKNTILDFLEIVHLC